MTYAVLLAAVITDTSVAQDENILAAADFSTRWADSMVRISIAVQSAVKVRLVPSSGTGFYLNGGSALGANAVHTETVCIDVGRTWNVQTDDASGCTVSHLVIQELSKIA